MQFALVLDAPLPASASAALAALRGVERATANPDELVLVLVDQPALVAAVSRADSLGLAIKEVSRTLDCSSADG